MNESTAVKLYESSDKVGLWRYRSNVVEYMQYMKGEMLSRKRDDAD